MSEADFGRAGSSAKYEADGNYPTGFSWKLCVSCCLTLQLCRLEPKLLFSCRRAPAPNQSPMETIETVKAEIKKLSSQAIQTKMGLHDLSEELPTGWEHILEVAEKTFVIHQKLAEARKKLAALGG